MKARYVIEKNNDFFILIRDVGDHTKVKTVTNDAEQVVKELSSYHNLGTKRLYYYDSYGDLDEILHVMGSFTGFGPVDVNSDIGQFIIKGVGCS